VHPEAHPGIGELGRSAVEEDPALEHDDAIEVAGHRAELVGDEQNRGTVLVDEVHERVAKEPLRLGVDTRDRLVEHEELRLAGEGLGDQRPLTLPPGELRELAMAVCAQCDRIERVVDRPAIGRPWPSPPGTSGKPAGGDRLLDRRGEVGGELAPLGHVAEPASLTEATGRGTEQLDSAVAQREQAEEQAQQRRLARAIGAHQGDELAGRDREVDAFEHGLGPVREGDLTSPQHRFARRPGGRLRHHPCDSSRNHSHYRLGRRAVPDVRAIRSVAVATAAVTIIAIAAGCGDGSGSGSGKAGSRRVEVVIAHYPFEWLVREIGGDAVTVANLTPVGAEPHELELTPASRSDIEDADLVVVLGNGFQPAVEEAAAPRDGETVVVLDHVDSNGAGDPHVWLDPVAMQEVAEVITAALSEAAPEQATTFERRASSTDAALGALDAEYRTQLRDCATTTLVTSHDAFGSLAERYDLQAVGVAGLSPDAVPDADRIAELADLVEARGVTVVFTEELVSPEIAETLASEAGVETGVLSPLEGLTDEQRDAGDDYLSVMRTNLAKIADALGCEPPA